MDGSPDPKWWSAPLEGDRKSEDSSPCREELKTDERVRLLSREYKLAATAALSDVVRQAGNDDTGRANHDENCEFDCVCRRVWRPHNCLRQ